MNDTADLILFDGRITTLDRDRPEAQAVAVRDGRFIAVGSDRDIFALVGPNTRRIALNGRRAIPGLIDSHTHVIRGGLNYNLELRWDGMRSLADAMRSLKAQVDRTPAPQWVRVIGGFTEQQFAERRLPTLDELNAIAPDTPVFILHLYDRALLNRAALRAVGGRSLYPAANRIERATALRLWTEANTWFSREEGKKGQIKTGQLADLAVLSEDYFALPEDAIQDIVSVLTLLGGASAHADREFTALAPPLPPVLPDWSPVRTHGGYQARRAERGGHATAQMAGSSASCSRHRHAGAHWGDVPAASRCANALGRAWLHVLGVLSPRQCAGCGKRQVFVAC